MDARRRTQAGFTIIEVLVAILIVAMAATATAIGMRATTNHVGSNELHARAIALTQEAIEDLRTQSFGDMVSGSSATSDGFNTIWQVVDDNPAPEMKLVSVTTSWQWRGAPRQYQIQTVYSQVTPN